MDTLLAQCQKIPGYMSGTQPRILYKLFEKFNHSQTLGVEIGSLHGRSSIAIAQAIPLGRLICIDTWSGAESGHVDFNDYQIQHLGYPAPGMRNTLEFFLENTKSCSNITTIQGKSPDVVSSWSDPIDFIFLDANHENPNDLDNIMFWLPYIKKPGCIAGHDYMPQYPDVIKNVQYLENILNKPCTFYPSSSIWSFMIE